MIRLAGTDDLLQINEIYNQAVQAGFCTAHTQPVSLEYRQDWFKKHHPKNHPVFVFTDPNNTSEVLGWLSVSPYRSGRQALDEVVEISYYVNQAHHNQGIGAALMDHALEYIKGSTIRLALAILVSGNVPSLRLLQKFDFREMGRIPDALRYGEEYRDHLYMGRSV